jgi:hypothetical protein
MGSSISRSILVTNPFKRGSAPGRERADDLRPGTFKSGHPKRGGRKRGTPNALFADYKRAIVEAAYRIGYDGNRKDGIVGYFRWIASRHPEVFGGVLLTNILALEFAEDSLSERIYPTSEGLNEQARDFIRLVRKEPMKKQTVRTGSPSAWDWTGQDFPVSSLMHLAVVNPNAFCKLIAAGFLRPPSKLQRGLAARRAWEQRHQAAGQRSWQACSAS